jgi:transglutaminase-like putative cysteine protease
MRYALIALALATSLSAAESKTYDATYVATLSEIRQPTEKLNVWIPLPASSEHQTVSDVTIESPYEFTRYREAAWGNEYAHATIANPPSSISIRVKFNVTRNEARLGQSKGSLGDRDQVLRADRLVTLSPRVRKLAADVTAGKKGTVEQARAIYDHLLATMTYDKNEPGWGLGDTERACDIRKGNCTDFHSLFMSLARAKGIPSRFVIGFPMTAAEGVVKGYHCWAEFWDGKGWVPVDASDASKNPKLADYLFGNLDPERMQFTVGRDLVLSPKTAEPLNYFIHPRGEANGMPTGVPSIALEFKPR